MNSLSAISAFNFSPYGGLLGQGLLSSYIPPLPKWIAVRQRFEQFHRNLSLTTLQQQDGHTKRAGVVGCLNRHYYASACGTDNSIVIGSWGKGTAIVMPHARFVFVTAAFASSARPRSIRPRPRAARNRKRDLGDGSDAT